MSATGITNVVVTERPREWDRLIYHETGLEITAMNLVSEALRNVGSLRGSLSKGSLSFREFRYGRWNHDGKGCYTGPFQATITPRLWVEGEITVNAPRDLKDRSWEARISFAIVNNFTRGREYCFSGTADAEGVITLAKA